MEGVVDAVPEQTLLCCIYAVTPQFLITATQKNRVLNLNLEQEKQHNTDVIINTAIQCGCSHFPLLCGFKDKNKRWAGCSSTVLFMESGE